MRKPMQKAGKRVVHADKPLAGASSLYSDGMRERYELEARASGFRLKKQSLARRNRIPGMQFRLLKN